MYITHAAKIVAPTHQSEFLHRTGWEGAYEMEYDHDATIHLYLVQVNRVCAMPKVHDTVVTIDDDANAYTGNC